MDVSKCVKWSSVVEQMYSSVEIIIRCFFFLPQVTLNMLLVIYFKESGGQYKSGGLVEV